MRIGILVYGSFAFVRRMSRLSCLHTGVKETAHTADSAGGGSGEPTQSTGQVRKRRCATFGLLFIQKYEKLKIQIGKKERRESTNGTYRNKLKTIVNQTNEQRKPKNLAFCKDARRKLIEIGLVEILSTSMACH